MFEGGAYIDERSPGQIICQVLSDHLLGECVLAEKMALAPSNADFVLFVTIPKRKETFDEE